MPPPLQQAQADHAATRAAAQAAAVNPPPRKQTVGEFLDGLDRELEMAPEAAAVHSLMMSERVTWARGAFTNGAAERLSDWTIRAGQKRAALQEAERQQQPPKPPRAEWKPLQAEQPPATTAKAAETTADPMNGPMPDDIAEWPLLGEEHAAG